MVTVLAGIIAVLGTSILFLSSESLDSFIMGVGKTLGTTTSDEESTQSDLSQPGQEQPSPPVEEQIAEEQPEKVVELAKIECEAMNMGGEYPVLHTGDECFKVTNVHTWINKISGIINERSTTAFVVENTGTKTITLDSVTLSDVPVPTTNWFFTTDPVVVRSANIQRDLPVDYTETAVAIGGGIVFMNTGIITLEPGQRAIVYLNEAGGLIERDVGLYLTLHVQAGQLQVEKAVPVVRA